MEDASPTTGEVQTLILSVEQLARGEGDISVGEIIAKVGDDAMASLMLLPALIMVSPASGIPFLSTFCAAISALAAIQLVIGRHRVWLPGFVRHRTIDRQKLHAAAGWLHKPARFLDRCTRKRLSALTRRPLSLAPTLICVLVACAVPFLELVPFTASVAGLAISLISLGLVARDGLLVLIGIGATSGIVWLAVTVTN